MMVILLGRCQFKSVRIPSPTHTCDFLKSYASHGIRTRSDEPSLGSTSSALTARPQASFFISSYSEQFEIFLSHNIFKLIAKRYFDMVGILCLKSSISNSYTYLDIYVLRISPEKQRPTLLSAEQSLGTQRE